MLLMPEAAVQAQLYTSHRHHGPVGDPGVGGRQADRDDMPVSERTHGGPTVAHWPRHAFLL